MREYTCRCVCLATFSQEQQGPIPQAYYVACNLVTWLLASALQVCSSLELEFPTLILHTMNDFSLSNPPHVTPGLSQLWINVTINTHTSHYLSLFT